MKNIPASLKKYFWDTNIKNVDPVKNRDYIIARLLDRGNGQAYRYVAKNFPKSAIIKTIKTTRGISARSANFWALFFGINPKEVACLQKASTKPPVIVWPY